MERKVCLFIDTPDPIQLTQNIISNKTVTFQPVMILPNFIINNQLLCGPLVMLIKQLAIKERVRLKYMPYPNNFLEAAMNLVTDPPNIFLMDFDSANFYHYEKMLREDWSTNISHTIAIDYNEFGNIAYLRQPGTQPMFTFFQCFTTSLWIFITILTMIIAFLLSLKKLTFKNYLVQLWNVYTTFLSKSISKEVDLTGKLNKLIMGSWLTIELLLTILFGSFLLDFMAQPIPSRIIDSWHDLYMRKEVKILASETNALTKFTELENTPMALNFRSRLEKVVPDTGEYTRNKHFVRIKNGECAFVTNRLVLIGNLFLLFNSSEEFLAKFHISKEGGGELPYFFAIHSSLDLALLQSLNDIILRARESGLFANWTDRVLKLVGNLRFLDQSSDQSIVKFEKISLKYMFDVYYLYVIDILFVFLGLFFEYFGN